MLKTIDKSEEKIRKDNNGKFELIRRKKDLEIYKYNLVSEENISKLITNHYYDNFDKNDIERAYIILFIGKTGDGKTTAINALFNIIKGIKFEDKYRFILINEKKKKTGQAESQTDGLHLYYLKDYNNNPIIIIDSQGFGDTRGKEYDELLREAFEYIFKNIIKHINLICFIAKSTDSRLDIVTKYIFSCVTSLFAEDISNNFIFLTTFADNTSIESGPIFIDSITKDDNFNNIISKFNEKWYYVIDSLCVLNNLSNNLAEYSFQQLDDLYEITIKNSRNKSIDKSFQVINYRNKIKSNINIIIALYNDIKTENNKINNINNKITEWEGKISVVNTEINNKNVEINQIYIPDKYYLLDIIKEDRDNLIRKLNNEYEAKYTKKLKYDGNSHTVCNLCETNCHEDCNCYLSFLILCNECIMFPTLSTICNHCGHSKHNHTIRGSRKWVTEREIVKINNDSKIERANSTYFRKYNEICDEYNRKVSCQNNKQRQLSELYKRQSNLEKIKSKHLEDKKYINDKIKKIISEIKNNFLILFEMSNSLNNIALNNFHFEIENEYIESLIYRTQEINRVNENEIKKLNEDKEYNLIILELLKLNKLELGNLSDDKFIDKINKIFIFYSTK